MLFYTFNTLSYIYLYEAFYQIGDITGREKLKIVGILFISYSLLFPFFKLSKLFLYIALGIALICFLTLEELEYLNIEEILEED